MKRARETLRSYVHDVKALPNEMAKRSRFSALIAELFPGTNATTEYSRGVEKLIRIQQPTREKLGRADAYYGNAIIEFEKSLAATGKEAEGQLQEYVAGTWQKDKTLRSLLAVASDGIVWRLYRPVLPPGLTLVPENISLELLREFKVSEETLGSFWYWLTSFLFRPQQLEPTAERFQLDFGTWSPLYRDGMTDLKRAWAKVGSGSEAKLACETWQSYLTVTYGSLVESTASTKDPDTAAEISEMENLFLRHTYLASFARLLIWAALSHGNSSGDLRSVAQEVLTGRYFESKRLANLVDDDFFHWIRNTEAEKILAPAWERILSHLTEYDLSMVKEDVLKGVYQQLIDPKDRHDLGEYYTPDWLCERVVAELLPKHGFHTVLDPTCGSGSFLRASISHFLAHNPEGTDNEKLRSILSSVQGIDIHPVAVTIARATYVLALGKLVNSARKQIQIPIYLADSLFLPREVEASLIESLGVEILYGSRRDRKKLVMPKGLIDKPELFDGAIAACTSIAEDHAKTKKDSRKAMEKYLSRDVPDLSSLSEYEQILDALWAFTEGLAELIREKKNSIWSFIIRNSYRPAMLKEQFDFIIGNPPWLSYRFISDPEYQEEVKRRAVGIYAIAPKSMKLFPQMELATVFLAHSMGTFASKKGQLAFVMPRAVLSADQHQNLILKKYNSAAHFALTGYWDLWDVTPLFNVPACILFAKRVAVPGSPKEKLPVLEWNGNLPGRDVPWEVAKTRLAAKSAVGRVIYLGTRAALSTAPGASAPSKPSDYQAAFRQGATIVPRSLYFVRFKDLPSGIDPTATYWGETDPEQAAQAKKPYEDVYLSGLVEGKFIFTTAVSRHLVPFGLLEPVTVVLPVEEKHGNLSIIEADRLVSEGYRHFGTWMREAELIWKSKRKDKADKQDLYEWLDYQGKLTHQDLKHRHLVLYNHSGMNVCATYFDRNTTRAPFIVDVKLYWAAFNTRQEADYVAAILNSETVNAAIKPFQSAGLLGERDIHKKLLELPIPTFNHENKKHMRISDLGARAREETKKALNAGLFPVDSAIARQRAFIRDNLKEVMEEIDALMYELLGGK